jgi:hypothetical protein
MTLYTSNVTAVGYMPFGYTDLHLIDHYQVLEITLLNSQMQENLSAQFT